EGAWGISPHFIPHRSGHAVSGTISQVLKIHGPNLGAGGGPGGAVDAFLAASVLVEGHGLPGVWVVLSAMDIEAIPAPDGTSPKAPSCFAVALALAAARSGWTGPQLRIVPGVLEEKCRHPALPATRMLGSLETLVGGLTGNKLLPTTLVWRLGDGGWLELRTGGLPRVQIPHVLHRLNGHRPVNRARPEAGTEKKW